MKKICTLLLLLVCTTTIVQAQTYNQLDDSGNFTQRNEYGNNSNFNPNSLTRYTTCSKIPSTTLVSMENTTR